jgi:hypothetical protein
MLARYTRRWLVPLVSLLVAIAALVTIPMETVNAAPLGTDAVIHQIAGADMPSCSEYDVCGTDLGVAYTAADGTIKFLFGDTFSSRTPDDSVNWRAPVALRSQTTPNAHTPITFVGAVGADGKTSAPELMSNGHHSNGEVSAIPNDGISFKETGEEIISYMSIRDWDNPPVGDWSTNYGGLAWSPDGNHFYRVGPQWTNTDANSDPFQMISMQRDGAYVYLVGVKAGRQTGPMVLMRVAWGQMRSATAYQCWNGTGWGGNQCSPLFEGAFGEPSLRKLSDNTWALAYFNAANNSIVTRTASSPTGPWRSEKVQLTAEQFPGLYGGFIHPYSTPDNLTLMVSSWPRNSSGQTIRYDVVQFNGTL